MAVRINGSKLAGFAESWVSGWTKKAARTLGRSKDDIAVVFIDARKMKKLNRDYRGLDKTTDVLSFSAGEKGELGDIFIAPAAAKIKAKERGESYRDYLALLIVHSVLHLGGYDHRTTEQAKAMARMEKKILI
jgi:probable rRNA maturation factor